MYNKNFSEKSVIEDYIKGTTLLEIQSKYNISEHTIYRVLKNNSINLRGKISNKVNRVDILYKKAIQEFIEVGTRPTVLSKKYKISDKTLRKKLKKLGFMFSKSNKQKIKNNVFDKIDTQEKAYWLGFLYADGNISKIGDKNNYRISLELSLKDSEHLEKFRNFIGKEIPNKKDSFRCRCSFVDKKMWKQLYNKGCTPQKSLKLKFPDKNILPLNLYNHFIRGYIDGDGSIFPNRNPRGNKKLRLSILGTKEFLKYLLFIFNRTDKKLYLNSRDKTKVTNCYFVEFGNKDSIRICNYLYNNAEIYLERKFEKYNEIAVLERNF
jgi:mobile intron protein